MIVMRRRREGGREGGREGCCWLEGMMISGRICLFLLCRRGGTRRTWVEEEEEGEGGREGREGRIV
jgi:hypothetical protein